MAKIFLFCLFLFFFLLTPPSVFSSNLLLNPSFEEVSEGIPTSWIKEVGTMNLAIFSPGSEGTNAVSVNKQNGKIGSISLSQEVDVEPEEFYSISGKIQKNSSHFSYALLRITWSGPGSNPKRTDSSRLTEDAASFKEIKIDSVQAPNFAIKAKIELVANIVTPDPPNPVLFDAISFSQIDPPEQPTPLPSPTPTKVPTPTKSPTSIPSKTPTPTASPMKSPSPLPTISLLLTPTSTVSPSFIPESEILGLATDTTPTPTIIVEQLQYEENISSLPAVFLMGVGGFLLLFCAILLYRSYRAQKG